MIFYLLNKGQQTVKLLNNDETIESNLDEAINTASELKFSLPLQKRLDSNIYYILIPEYHGNDFLMFKIISEDVQKDRVEYSAVESAYDELKSYEYIKDIRPHQMNAAQMLQQVLKNTRWSLGYVEDTGIQSTTFYYITILEAIQKIVDLFKVELTFTIQLDPVTQKITGRRINLYQQQGRRTGKRFEYGSNLLTVTREEDSQNLVTALVGRGKGIQVSGQDTEDASDDNYGRRLTFADVEWKTTAGAPVDKPKGQEYVEDPKATALYGFSDGQPRIGLVTFDDIEDPNQLINATWSALLEAKRPKVSFKAEVTDVGNLQLGDTIAIIRHDLGIEYFTRVYKVHHDLKDKNKNTVEMGDDFSSRSIASAISTAIQTSQDATEIANAAATSANGKNRNFYSDTKPNFANEGDNLYLDLGNGETELWVWHHGQWEFVQSTVELHTVQKQVQETQSGLNDAKKQISDNLAKADGDIAELNANIREQKKAFDTDIDELNASIRDQKGTIDGLSTTINTVAIPKITDVTNKVSDALTKINDQKNIVTELQNQATQQGKDISKITADVHGVTVDLANLNGDVNQTKATVQGLQSTLGNAQGDIAQIKVDAKKLETSLSGKVDTAKNDAVNAIKGDANWTGLTNIITNSGFLQSVDGFVQKVQQTTLPMFNGGGVNLQTGTGDCSLPFSKNNGSIAIEKYDDRTQMIHSYGENAGFYLGYASGYFIPEIGETYTFSADIKGKGSIDGYRFKWEGSDSVSMGTVALSDNWQRISNTVHVSTLSGTWVIYPTPDSSGVNDFYVKHIKIERGSVATPWSPNPADLATQVAFTELTQTVQGLRSTVSGNYGTLQTQISQTAGTISTVVGKVNNLELATNVQIVDHGIDLNTYKSTGTWFVKGSGTNAPASNWFYLDVKTAWDGRIVQTWQRDDVPTDRYVRTYIDNRWSNWERSASYSEYSTLNQTVKGLQSTLGNAQGDIAQIKVDAKRLETSLSGKVDTAKNDAVNAIKGDANWTGLTNIITNSGFLQSVDGFVQKVQQTTLPMFNGGGVNLQTGTGDCSLPFSKNNGSIAIEKYDDRTQMIHSYGENAGFYLGYASGYFIPEIGETYTFSADIKGKGSIDGYRFKWEGSDSVSMGTVALSDNWQRISNTVHVSTLSGTWVIYPTPDSSGVNDFYVKHIKIERGSVATPWSPNPADLATQVAFTELTQTVQGLQSTVSNNYTNLQSQISQTAKTIRQEVSDKTNGLQTQINQQANNFNVSLNSLRNETAWQKVTSAIDANNYKTTGNYWIQAVPNSNTPDSSAWAYLQVVAYPDVKRIKQTWQRDNNENEIYTRLLIGDNWTSWQRTVTGGNIMAQINMSAGTTLIQNEKIYMDASSTVFSGKAFIPDAAITNISADKINTGTLDAGRINVINLNASNITTGTINGANLKINLNSGEILFQKGRIASTNGNLNIDLDNGRMSVTNWMNQGVYFENGNMVFDDQAPWLTSNNDPKYGGIKRADWSTFAGSNGLEIYAQNGIVLKSQNFDGALDNGSFLDNATMGAAFGLNKDGEVLLKSTKYITLTGGNRFDLFNSGKYPKLNPYPSISIGTGAFGGNDAVKKGSRIIIEASYLHVPSAYVRTTGSAPNVYVASDGALVRSTSASKYKTDIKRSYSTEYGEKLLNLPTAIWTDKGQKERYEAGKRHIKPEKYFGMIAEDLADAGLDLLVSRNPLTHEIEGIQYERIAPALLPVIKKLKDKVDKLEEKINE